MTMPKTVAIIGAGVSGLAAIKCSLEVGLEPTAFEKDPWIGGVWRYTDLQDEKERRSCVARSTVTNTSKHMMCYSDFPMPKEWPNYLQQDKYLKYFQMYTKHFQLEDKIRFHTTVTAIKPCRDYSETGRWQVCYVDHNKDGSKVHGQRMEEFDFVMVCSGVFLDPLLPDITGLEKFSGEVIHSQEYRTWKKFEGKRVVVVGLGNSAGDIACELSRHAAQVYLSTRGGAWVTSRLGDGGQPNDVLFLSRFISMVPVSVVAPIISWNLKNKFNLSNFGLEPAEMPMRRFPIINDELPHRIITGSIQVKSDIAEVERSSVVFKDGSQVEDIDSIILATGFKFSFPVLSDRILCPTKRYVPLYKYVFPPSLDQGTLAVIGAVRVNGPVPPVVDMQARWAVRVFLGENKLPDYQTMMNDVKERQRKLEAGTCECTRAFHLVKVIDYQDEIASEIGAKPNLWHLLRNDPVLALKCFFGPCVPAQFRLVGPGAWQGARDVIMSVQESMAYPLRTRTPSVMKKGQKSALGWKSYLYWVFILIGLVMLFSFVIF